MAELEPAPVIIPSLFDLAHRAVLRHIDDIIDVGEAPYQLIRHAMKKIQSPGQLYAIEKASPHIAEETAELWHAMIIRDIPNGKNKILENTPKDPTKWHKVYAKLKKDDQRQQNAAEEQLKAALNQKKVDKEAHSTQIIHAVIPQGKKATFGGPRAAPSGIQALRNARTTADKLTILRRQTANRQQGRTVTQSVPTHELQQKRSVVQQAPKSMVNAYSRANVATPAANHRPIQQPQVLPQRARPTTVFTSRAGPMSERDRVLNAAIRKEREDKERRLRALTGTGPPVPSQPSASRSAATATTTASCGSAKPTITRTTAFSAPKPVITRTPVSQTSASRSATAAPASASPPSQTSASQTPNTESNKRPAGQSSAMMPPRKRQAYNPMMPAKKRKI